MLEIIIIKFSFPVCFRLKLLFPDFSLLPTSTCLKLQPNINGREKCARCFYANFDWWSTWLWMLTFSIFWILCISVPILLSSFYLALFHRRNYASNFNYLMKLKIKDSATNNHNNIIILTIYHTKLKAFLFKKVPNKTKKIASNKLLTTWHRIYRKVKTKFKITVICFWLYHVSNSSKPWTYNKL